MRVRRATVRAIERRLEAPISSASAAWSERSGLLLELETDDGQRAYGEASPLPGYSSDELRGCALALTAIDWARAPALDHGAPVRTTLAGFAALVAPEQRAARMALETAALDLLAWRAARPAWTLLGDRVDPGDFALTKLLTDPATALDAALVARRSGYVCFKLKVGRPGAFDAELALARRLRQTLGDEVALRFDANGAWTPTEAVPRLAALAELNPEFVEQPVPPGALQDLARQRPGSAPPLALDESLQGSDLTSLEISAWGALGVRALVLKPMALGGLTPCLRLAELAREQDLALIVSHLFDGPLALASCAALALAVGSRGRAVGLDRHPGLFAWPPVTLAFLDEARLCAGSTPGLGVVWQEPP